MKPNQSNSGKPRQRMRFNLHPWKYRVRVCPGPLVQDDVAVAATSHGREILLCGTLKPHERTEALIDQLRRLREKHHGPIAPEGVASFVADVMRQLLRQGGEAALKRLKPEASRAAVTNANALRTREARLAEVTAIARELGKLHLRFDEVTGATPEGDSDDVLESEIAAAFHKLSDGIWRAVKWYAAAADDPISLPGDPADEAA
jgi:hypothetical protein